VKELKAMDNHHDTIHWHQNGDGFTAKANEDFQLDLLQRDGQQEV
jgi:hypothetical protein